MPKSSDNFSQLNEFWVKHAIDVIKETYGDTVRVKPKDLLKFGKNPNVGSTVQCDVMELAGSETSETLLGNSQNLIDSFSCTDASFTGAVVIEGHTDSSGVKTFVSQNITADGQNEVTLATPLNTATRMFISGSTAMAASKIAYVYNNTGVTLASGVPNIDSQVHLIMQSDDNQSLKCSTAFSNQDYGLITEFFCSVNKRTSATVDVRIKVKQKDGVFRSVVPPMTLNTTGTGDIHCQFRPFLIVPKNSFIKATAIASTTSVEVSACFNSMLAIVQ